MDALRARLDGGRPIGIDLASWFFGQLKAILERYAHVGGMLSRPLPIGRPKRLDRDLPKRRGAPTKFTRETETWFIAEIDSWKLALSTARMTATDSNALRLSLAAHHFRRRQAGLGLSDEKYRAKWISAISGVRAKARSEHDRPITVERALLLVTARLFETEHRLVGLAPAEARRLATAQARAFFGRPIFRTRLGQLARLRSGSRMK